MSFLCLSRRHGLVDQLPIVGIVNHAEVGLDGDFLPALADDVVGQFVDVAGFCLSRKLLQPDFNPVHVPRGHDMDGFSIDPAKKVPQVVIAQKAQSPLVDKEDPAVFRLVDQQSRRYVSRDIVQGKAQLGAERLASFPRNSTGPRSYRLT